LLPLPAFFSFSYAATATTQLYTLSLHDALPIFGNARITRGRVNLLDVPILRERPSKSVLSAAASNDENLHSATSRIECQAFISSRVRSTGFFFNPRYSPVTQAKHISPC